MRDASLDVVEADIATIRRALETGALTSVELTHEYLRRIAHLDRRGPRLNSVPVLNPEALNEARASDRRRERGEALGPLDGIPYTAKDSYKVKGLTVAAGSPAFADLTASDDAYTIAKLRAAGAILLGLTNMPPMAAGGMQRGVYGRAESPYNAHYLTAAYGSGSSNGSGTSTASSFAAFGLGEETWSSGRSPASNNGLIAYTPSRGVISMRGNWPLYAAMDVVVPHARTMADLLEVLDVIVDDDNETRGDFWRVQPWVELPRTSDLRPDRYEDLAEGDLAGRRFGVPRMYINRDPDSNEPIETRATILDLWSQAKKDLESAGAEIVEVDFPAVSNYETDRPGARSMYERGLVPPEFLRLEMWDLIIWAWNDFLDQNQDHAVRSLDDIEGRDVFPAMAGALPDRYPDDADLADLVTMAQSTPKVRLEDLPHVADALPGLEETRRVDFDLWLDGLQLDGVVFPANADVAPFDADFNLSSNDIAWRNGVRYSNGNLAIRHLGIPTVTVPMGQMADTDMPVGLTFAGRGYDDAAILRHAASFESIRNRRRPPTRAPRLTSIVGADTSWHQIQVSSSSRSEPELQLEVSHGPMAPDGTRDLRIVAWPSESMEIAVFLDGVAQDVEAGEGCGITYLRARMDDGYVFHSPWWPPYESIVSALGRDASGRSVATYEVIAVS